jgi:hypothetical protein
MIRTQIQLTEEQAEALKRLALVKKKSIAGIIREAVDLFLISAHEVSSQERISKALAMAGRFTSDCGDLSVAHDSHPFEEHH